MMTSRPGLALQNVQAGIPPAGRTANDGGRRLPGSAEQVAAAERHLVAIQADHGARVAAAEQVVAARRRVCMKALVDLAVIVNDDNETAELVGVGVREVRTARRAAIAARPPLAAAGRVADRRTTRAEGRRRRTSAHAVSQSVLLAYLLSPDPPTNRALWD